jgi:surface antigen
VLFVLLGGARLLSRVQSQDGRMVRLRAAACLLCGFILAGCVTTGQGQSGVIAGLDGCSLGAGVGAMAGGLGAAFLNRGGGSTLQRFAAPALGTAAGGWIGSQIGCALAPPDQQRASAAVASTAATGRGQTWSSPDTGVSGQTRVVATGDTCRTIEQVVTLSDGSQRTEQVRACRGANGWEVAG